MLNETPSTASTLLPYRFLRLETTMADIGRELAYVDNNPCNAEAKPMVVVGGSGKMPSARDQRRPRASAIYFYGVSVFYLRERRSGQGG
jgi:hypothetical protein